MCKGCCNYRSQISTESRLPNSHAKKKKTCKHFTSWFFHLEGGTCIARPFILCIAVCTIHSKMSELFWVYFNRVWRQHVAKLTLQYFSKHTNLGIVSFFNQKFATVQSGIALCSNLHLHTLVCVHHIISLQDMSFYLCGMCFVCLSM